MGVPRRRGRDGAIGVTSAAGSAGDVVAKVLRRRVRHGRREARAGASARLIGPARPLHQAREGGRTMGSRRSAVLGELEVRVTRDGKASLAWDPSSEPELEDPPEWSPAVVMAEVDGAFLLRFDL